MPPHHRRTTIRRTRPLLVLLAVLAGTIAPAQASPAGASLRVQAGPSRFGTVLFDGHGRALYLFTREHPGGKPACYGACARAWPPALTRGTPTAGPGADASLIGTARRRDHTRQLTYRGRPLYYYVGDTEAGQIFCQDVREFGGTWLVVSPSGRAVH